VKTPPTLPAPHLLAGALCLGLAASLATRSTDGLVALGALALAAASLAFRARRILLLGVAILLAGWWWGSVRLAALDRSTLLGGVGRTAPARLEVTGPARQSPFAVRVPVRVLEFGERVLDERSRLDLPRGRAPPQGAVVWVVARVEHPRGREDDGFDESTYLRRQGIHVVLSADSFRIVGRRGGIGGAAASLRGHLAGSLAPGVRGERRAVIAGILLGEDEGLDADLRQSFRASGLYHLLAVSGQNVAYVVAGALLLAWLIGFPRVVGEAGAVVAVVGYVMAVGWQPSVVRAGVAGGLASLAWLCGRARDRWYFLLAGAAVLLCWNPYSLLEPGFQLSFAAVAAIFVLVPRMQSWLEGYPIPARLATVLAVSGACGAVTAPILMMQFGQVPVYSIASNALAAPVVAPLLGLALVCAALDPVLPSAAAALAWVNGWLAAYLATVARFFGGLPHAQLASWKALAGLCAAILFLTALVRLPPPRGGRAVLAMAVLAVVLAGWRLRPDHAPPPPNGLRITFLDVGQGDSALVQVPEGAVLVDEGPPEARVAQQLEDLGVRRLAALVLTHPQRDHVGGAADVIDDLPVGFVLDPGIPAASPDERAARAAAGRHGVRIVLARAGESFRLGELRLRVLWPDGPGAPGEDPNQHAIVLLASYGVVDALLTADAESDVTLPLDLPAVEVLKVAHHGSADTGLGELLARLRPRVAVISVGARNDYGHPAATTIATLRHDPGLALYRTDLDGRVTVESADGVHLTTTRER
jgi:competence protein ComEC